MSSPVDFDALLDRSRAALASLSAKRDALRTAIGDFLVAGQDTKARDAQADAARLTDDLALEATRYRALQDKRDQLETDAAKAAQLAAIVELAEKRVAEAKRADAAIAAAGRSVNVLTRLSADLDRAILQMPRNDRPALRRTDEQVRLAFGTSLCAAGFGWLFPDAYNVQTEGRLLTDSVAGEFRQLHHFQHQTQDTEA